MTRLVDAPVLGEPEGFDKSVLLAAIRLARELSVLPPFSDEIEREVVPGPQRRRHALFTSSAANRLSPRRIAQTDGRKRHRREGLVHVAERDLRMDWSRKDGWATMSEHGENPYPNGQ